MKIKTSELNHDVLDWAVAQSLGYHNLRKNAHRFNTDLLINDASNNPVFLKMLDFHRNWSLVGPLIEQHQIQLTGGSPWVAYLIDGDLKKFESQGDTPLVAALRCYITRQMGEEIEIPDILGKRMTTSEPEKRTYHSTEVHGILTAFPNRAKVQPIVDEYTMFFNNFPHRVLRDNIVMMSDENMTLLKKLLQEEGYWDSRTQKALQEIQEGDSQLLPKNDDQYLWLERVAAEATRKIEKLSPFRFDHAEAEELDLPKDVYDEFSLNHLSRLFSVDSKNFKELNSLFREIQYSKTEYPDLNDQGWVKISEKNIQALASLLNKTGMFKNEPCTIRFWKDYERNYPQSNLTPKI